MVSRIGFDKQLILSTFSASWTGVDDFILTHPLNHRQTMLGISPETAFHTFQPFCIFAEYYMHPSTEIYPFVIAQLKLLQRNGHRSNTRCADHLANLRALFALRHCSRCYRFGGYSQSRL